MQNHHASVRTTALAWPLAVVVLASGCQSTPPARDDRAATSAAAAAKMDGYLRPEERPDSVALLPAPPTVGSKEAAEDLASYQRLRSLEGSPRWHLAHDDANLKFPGAANHYACTLGFRVDPEATPHLYRLIHRTVIDAGQSTYPAKLKYNRKRPFEETGDPTCVPEDESFLRGNASYPSGHASLGFVWGEVLAEVVPERTSALRERAYQFGQSRVVCRLHYQSDVDGGRAVGAAVMPVLRANAAYRADVEGAKVEARRMLAAGQGPGKDCEAEAAALLVTASQPEVRP